jgi:hypothetical protein
MSEGRREIIGPATLLTMSLIQSAKPHTLSKVFQQFTGLCLGLGIPFRAETYMQQPNWFPGECAHIPGLNITLFVYLDPGRNWVAGARRHFSSEWLFEDDSPHSLDQAKKIATEWALKNIRMKSTFDFERGFPWHDIAEGWAIAFPKCADEE